MDVAAQEPRAVFHIDEAEAARPGFGSGQTAAVVPDSNFYAMFMTGDGNRNGVRVRVFNSILDGFLHDPEQHHLGFGG